MTTTRNLITRGFTPLDKEFWTGGGWKFWELKSEAAAETTQGGHFGLGATLSGIAAIAAVGAVLLRRKSARMTQGEDLH